MGRKTPYLHAHVFNTSGSVRANTDMYRLSADISVIGRYIGLADKANAYRYRLSVSADKPLHIGF